MAKLATIGRANWLGSDICIHLRSVLSLIENNQSTKWEEILPANQAYLVRSLIDACQRWHAEHPEPEPPATVEIPPKRKREKKAPVVVSEAQEALL